jgi:hypothetical protein
MAGPDPRPQSSGWGSHNQANQYPGNAGVPQPPASPYGPQPGYGPPPQYPQPRPFSTKAIVAMVCGGLCVLLWPISLIAGPVGMITGWLGMKESKGPGATRQGWGLALAGLILSACMFLLSLLFGGLMFWVFTRVEDAQERMQVEAQQHSARHDMQLMRDRLEIYFYENGNSLGPGGPLVRDNPGGGLFADDHPRIQGPLKIEHLVYRHEIVNGVNEYTLDVLSDKGYRIRHNSSGEAMTVRDVHSGHFEFTTGTK